MKLRTLMLGASLALAAVSGLAQATIKSPLSNPCPTTTACR